MILSSFCGKPQKGCPTVPSLFLPSHPSLSFFQDSFGCCCIAAVSSLPELLLPASVSPGRAKVGLQSDRNLCFHQTGPRRMGVPHSKE